MLSCLGVWLFTVNIMFHSFIYLNFYPLISKQYCITRGFKKQIWKWYFCTHITGQKRHGDPISCISAGEAGKQSFCVPEKKMDLWRSFCHYREVHLVDVEGRELTQRKHLKQYLVHRGIHKSSLEHTQEKFLWVLLITVCYTRKTFWSLSQA